MSPQSTGLPTLNQEASRPFWVPVPSSESRALAAPSAGGRAATPGLPPHSGLPSTAGSTKYFGTAKVRYDFCARDRSELNLKEGDIVKILNKKGQQGWWRGEIYGRVSRGGGAGGSLAAQARLLGCAGLRKLVNRWSLVPAQFQQEPPVWGVVKKEGPFSRCQQLSCEDRSQCYRSVSEQRGREESPRRGGPAPGQPARPAQRCSTLFFFFLN